MERIRLRAYAKINLTLDVIGKYPNGYHQVEMIMQQIHLFDDVLIRWFDEDCDESDHFHKIVGCGESPDGVHKVEENRLSENVKIKVNTNKFYIPNDRRNLAYQAAEAIFKRAYNKGLLNAAFTGTLKIDIKKRIPVAAGLAGGSSNGAAVLHGLNKLWNLKMSLKELCEIGAELGSDVPFCLMNQAKANTMLGKSIVHDEMATAAAFATGTGTDLKPIKPFIGFVLLSKPSISVSTAEVYGGLKLDEIHNRPDNRKMIEAIEKIDMAEIGKNAVNVLEEYTLNNYSSVRKTKEKMKEVCPESIVTMSGSGPTIVGIANRMSALKDGYLVMKSINVETYKTRTMV